MTKINLYEKFLKYEVRAESLEDFCKSYHKPFESGQFGKEQRIAWLNNANKQLKRDGYVLIPDSTTNTGKPAVYYAKGEIDGYLQKG